MTDDRRVKRMNILVSQKVLTLPEYGSVSFTYMQGGRGGDAPG